MLPERIGEGAGAGGAFAVVASVAEAEAFRLATGCRRDGLRQGGDILPATFPMRWLAGSDVRRALLAAVPEPGLVPVHEGQGFDYEHPLRVGVPYWLKLAARREAGPPRLVVEGVIEDADGGVHARLHTVLRLVAIGEAA